MATQFYYRLPSDLNNDLVMVRSFTHQNQQDKHEFYRKEAKQETTWSTDLNRSRDELERGSWITMKSVRLERSKPKRVKRVAKTVKSANFIRWSPGNDEALRLGIGDRLCQFGNHYAILGILPFLTRRLSAWLDNGVLAVEVCFTGERG